VADGALLARMAADHGLQARVKGLSFRCETPPAPALLMVHSDPALLERVLRNLLSTAIRYTAHGGVLLMARARHGRIELLVSDTGVALPGGGVKRCLMSSCNCKHLRTHKLPPSMGV